MTTTDETTTSDAAAHAHPYTLAIDIGGTGLKANVLDATGGVVADRVRVPTTYPLPPTEMVEKLKGLADKLPAFDRVSAGFPGMVRQRPRPHRPALRLQVGSRLRGRAQAAQGVDRLRHGLRPHRGPRPARPRGQRRRRAGPRRHRGQGLRGRHHPRDRLRLRLLHGRQPAPAHGVRPGRVPQGRDLQRRSWASTPARRSATSAGTSGCRRPSPTSTS